MTRIPRYSHLSHDSLNTVRKSRSRPGGINEAITRITSKAELSGWLNGMRNTNSKKP